MLSFPILPLKVKHSYTYMQVVACSNPVMLGPTIVVASMWNLTPTGATMKQDSSENALHLLTPGQGMVKHDCAFKSIFS